MKGIGFLVWPALFFGLLSVAATVFAEAPAGNHDVSRDSAETANFGEESASSGTMVNGMDFAPTASGSRVDALFVIWNALGLLLCASSLFLLMRELIAGEKSEWTNNMGLGGVRTGDKRGTSDTVEPGRRSS
jgi:hypothetical protein